MIVLDVRLSVNLTSITKVVKMQRSHQTLLSLLSNSFKAELPPDSPALDALTPLLHLEDRAANADPHQFNNIDFSSTRLALEARGGSSSASHAGVGRDAPRAATRRAARTSSSAEDPRTGMPEGETTPGGRAPTPKGGRSCAR